MSPASWGARVVVWVLLTLGWGVFLAWWVVVLRRERLATLGGALGVLAGGLAISAVLTVLWTRHNLRIARNGKRGRSSLYIPMRWDRDTLGRPIELPTAGTAPAEVRIVLRDGVKVYIATEDEL